MSRIFTPDERSEAAAHAAADTPMSGQEMLQLASARDVRVREAVAQRPDVPIGTMIVLAQDKKADVRASLAANPAAGRADALVALLAQDRDVSVLLALARNADVPRPVLESLAERGNDEVKVAARRTLDHGAASVHRGPDGARGLGIESAAAPEDDGVPRGRATRTAAVRGFKPQDG